MSPSNSTLLDKFIVESLYTEVHNYREFAFICSATMTQNSPFILDQDLDCSGYVLSREATRKFVEEALPNKSICKQSNQGLEDVEIAGCLLKSGVLIGDSRDSLERGRFFPLGPHIHIRGGIPQWYKKNAFYKPYAVSNQNGFYCCHLSAVGGFRVQ
nr:glycoprotein-N-acetylgalactosamine 3-beta-galactosyltransferase 1-like [Penaeus vannamei]